MKVSFLTAMLMASAIATPAFAQASEESPFTGFRLEGFGGVERVLPDRKSAGPVTTTATNPKHTGGLAGVEAGYDYMLGPVVVGAFGSFAYDTPNGCGTLGGTNVGCLRPGRELAGGARVGYVYDNKFMVYAKGSYVNTLVHDTVQTGPGAFNSSHRNIDGWRAAGGVEYSINPHFYLKAEYGYGRTEHFDATPYGYQNTRISYHQQQGLGGFGIRF